MPPWDHTRRGTEQSRLESLSPADRRAAKRKRQRLIDGFISSGLLPPRPCRICDMSATGSKVELWGDDSQPLLPGDRVTLYIPADRNEIDGEVVGRTSKAIGMRFTSDYREPTRPYD